MNKRVYSTRGLPGLAVADWVTELRLPILPSNCFKTGRRSLTQSSVRPCGAETANGSLVLEIEEPAAERPAHASSNEKELTPALLRSASGELLPS